MRALKIILHFVIFAIFLINLNGVLGKISMAMAMATGGCASFGHSCYGGHGKRSQQGNDLYPSETIFDRDLSRNSNRDREPATSEQFSSIYDAIGRPENDFKSLLRKLAKSYEENQQLHSKYLPKYFNY